MQEQYQQHISQGFNSDLKALTLQLTHMGGLVEQQVEQATQALLTMNADLARQVQAREAEVDNMDFALSEACTRVLALRQPAASDLRRVVAISRSVSDLERIGDEANKIAHMTLQLIEDGAAQRGYLEVRHISQQVSTMLHDVLHTFVRQDVEEAVAVVAQDEVVDMEYHSAMRSLITLMMEDPRSISQVLNVIWVLRALERIGDHVSNIAEQVVYLVKGRDMRHTSPQEMKALLSKPVAD